MDFSSVGLLERDFNFEILLHMLSLKISQIINSYLYNTHRDVQLGYSKRTL